MRPHLAHLAVAVLAALSLTACTDQKELLAPKSSTKLVTIGIDRPPLDSIPRIAICRPTIIGCPNPFVDVSAGNGVTCAVRASGQLSCWGDNKHGMLGRGVSQVGEWCTTELGYSGPCSSVVTAIPGGFSSVSVGMAHVCAIQRGTGAAFCWGANNAGQLGFTSGTTLAPGTPVPPPAGSATPLVFSMISASGSSSCGVTTSQQLYCWGGGQGPTPVLDSRASYSSVSASMWGTCELRTDAYTCARSAAIVNLGQGTAAYHLCQVANSGRTECWGDNSYGQLGNGTTLTRVSSYSPVLVPGFSFNSVATGYNHTCALAGTVGYCWGDNGYGQLGLGSAVPGPNVPQRVTIPYSTTPNWRKISTGYKHTCGIDDTGSVWCWGENDMGQLGLGWTWDWRYQNQYGPKGVTAPSRVAGP